jgi:phage-related minor tail protein
MAAHDTTTTADGVTRELRRSNEAELTGQIPVGVPVPAPMTATPSLTIVQTQITIAAPPWIALNKTGCMETVLTALSDVHGNLTLYDRDNTDDDGLMVLRTERGDRVCFDVMALEAQLTLH